MSGNGAAPAVSVVVTAYNPGGFLREAVASVVAQTFTDWDMVVVDDGSDEDLGWVTSADPRVSLVRQHNQGVATARNHGIAVTRGRFIAFLDHDDRWRPTKLERQVELLRAGSVFCHTAFDLIDAQGTHLGPGWCKEMGLLDLLAGGHQLLLSSSIVDRAVLQRVGVFNPMFRVTEDYDLFYRLARSYEFSYVPTAEVDYRRHAGNASNNYWLLSCELRQLHAREARCLMPRRNMMVAQAIREGERRRREGCSLMAVDAARSAARMHQRAAAAGHLIRAGTLSPAALKRTCASFIRKRLHR